MCRQRVLPPTTGRPTTTKGRRVARGQDSQPSTSFDDIRQHNRPRLNWWLNDLDALSSGSPQEIMFIEGQKLEGNLPISGRIIDLLENPGRLATHKKLLGILARMREENGDPYKALHHYHVRQDAAGDLVKLEDLAHNKGSVGAHLMLGLIRDAKNRILCELERDGFWLQWGESKKTAARAYRVKETAEDEGIEDARVYLEECARLQAEGALKYKRRALLRTAERRKRAKSTVEISIKRHVEEREVEKAS